MSRIILQIPRVPPSLNIQMHWHWSKRKKEKLLWQQEIITAFGAGRIPQATDRMKMEITMFNSRLYDADNLAGAYKVVVDAIKELGFIKEDSRKWVDLQYDQMKVPRNKSSTHIEIQEAA
jgi:hypothetical protein